jgi:hypothetical protein
MLQHLAILHPSLCPYALLPFGGTAAAENGKEVLLVDRQKNNGSVTYFLGVVPAGTIGS